MKRLALVFLVLIPLLQLSVLAKDKEWKKGKLISVEPVDEWLVNYLYKIDDGKIIWVANRSGGPKFLVTVNTEVKFAVDGSHLFLIDENGKEHKLDLQHKILKE